jgi:hypothetical protein
VWVGRGAIYNQSARAFVVRLHTFVKICGFLIFFQNNLDFFRFLQISSENLSEICEKRNLNVLTSELDSESLSTLRKIIFKRDSCKLLVDVTSVTTLTSACHFLISEKFRKFQKVSKSFRKFQKVSESFRKFQKVSESADLT